MLSCEILTGDLTYALSLPVYHTPQTTCFHPALSCAATSICLQLYMNLAIFLAADPFSRVLLGRSLPLLPCDVGSSTCVAMQSSFLLVE